MRFFENCWQNRRLVPPHGGLAPPPMAVADLGFPRGGAPTYVFAKTSQKLHEIERIWTPGGRPKFYYVDPPLYGECWIRICGFLLV